MGFEISKDTLLKVSGVSAVAYCTFATVAPREFHKTFMSTVRVARCSEIGGAKQPRSPICHHNSAGTPEGDA